MNQRAKRAVEREFREETGIVLNIIWELHGNKSFKQIADESGLTTPTVRKLWGGLYLYPQFLTIQKLAASVGMDIAMTADGMVTNLQPVH